MHKKHKPRHAGTAVMLAAALSVILLTNQDRDEKIICLEAEIQQAVAGMATQTYQEALAGEKQALQYRYIKGCPLSQKVQREIFHICEDAALSFELVMSLIYEESGWDPECISDNGESVGLMQIQEKWHGELMDKTGCTDPTDPVQNVRAGAELLKRHFCTYQDPAWALMAYNGGQAYADRMVKAGKTSAYAERILRRAARYERNDGI
ncbi:MAG: lytic transglycosylase domain-containing protein [Eubacterium sp.]|nr:lytic transglycosylase domain-containing protein [Eubacterium sp.]